MNSFPIEVLKVHQNNNKIRVGNEGARGYVIMDGLKYDALISCGVMNDDTFEQIFLNKNRNIKGFLFGNDIKNMPYTHQRSVFKLSDIGIYDTPNTTNLHQLMNQHNDIFLKMTVNGSEIGWFNTLSTLQLEKLKQIVVEFNINTEKFSNNEKYKVLAKLAKTHYLIHLHGNNNYGVKIHTYKNSEYVNIGSSKNQTKIIKLNKYYDKSTQVVLKPNSHQDLFTFQINGQYLIVTRKDKIGGWGYNHTCIINGQYIPEVFECTYVRKSEIDNIGLSSSPILPLSLDMPHNPSKLDIQLEGYPYCHVDNNKKLYSLLNKLYNGPLDEYDKKSADQYCQYISDFIRDHQQIKKVADYSCGAKQLMDKINWHQAIVCDSNIIFEENRVNNEDEYEVDLVLLRMIFQYLSLTDINRLLDSLPKSRYYLITDYQPSTLTYENVDKHSGNSVRETGLYLESAPFNLSIINKLSYDIGDKISRTVQYIPYRLPFFQGVNLTPDEQLSRGKPKYYMLETLKMLKKYGTIVELGVARFTLNHKIVGPYLQNHCFFCNDGHSTYVWNCYHKNGPIFSIDISKDSIQMLKNTIDSPNHYAICDDGIKFLREFNEGKIDLLFLDAWDVLPDIPFAEKHLEAYLTAKDKLSDDCLILIDDTDVANGGKGKLLIPELLKDGYRFIFRGRQTLLSKNIPIRKFEIFVQCINVDTIKLCIESVRKYLPEVESIFLLTNVSKDSLEQENLQYIKTTNDSNDLDIRELYNIESARDILLINSNTIFKEEMRFYEDDGKIRIPHQWSENTIDQGTQHCILLSRQILDNMVAKVPNSLTLDYDQFSKAYVNFALTNFPELVTF